MYYSLLLFILSVCECKRPNIVVIVADDLGWNDIGIHGSNQIPTPNIDALAASGLTLHNYYVTPICTPSRAALMTGKYPIHTGMQHSVIFAAEPRGLPLSEKLLSQYLKELDYQTHLVGKWHLGSFKKEYLPLNRGFDSHLGFWSGKIDMYDHTNEEQSYWGYDFRRGFEVAFDLFGKYATDVYTNEAVKIIKSHNDSQPLFLMVTHSAVHSGNPYEPLRAPEGLIANFTYINNFQRRKFAAMLTRMDESVGEVVQALQDRGILKDSIILFTTDNGGPADGFNSNRASNFPLRGVKNTLWEGGVRGAGILWSPMIENKPRVAKQMLDIADWLPSLLSAAGMNVSTIKDIDGIDQWQALSKDTKSDRVSILHNIDDIYGNAAITINNWKLILGSAYKGAWDSWYGPSGRSGSYNVRAVLDGPAGKAIGNLGLMPSAEQLFKLRKEATVECTNTDAIPCDLLKSPCLFDIEKDPCEFRNRAESEPQILQDMLEALAKINKTALPPNNKPLEARGNPKYWGQVVTNFADYV